MTAKIKPQPAADHITRVLVVDDSMIIRRLVSRIIQTDPDCVVVGAAHDGQMAIDSLRRDPADVVILDIDMPVMDGLTAIPHLKAIDSAVQIIVASTLTQRNAQISLRALTLGATDYIPKPSSENEMYATADFSRELLEKIKVLGALARRRGARKKFSLRKQPVMRPDVIAIGSSTGGPQALFAVISKIGADLQQPVLITQHMPPAFTTILAERIAHECKVKCTEAADGDLLQAGHYYVAPGDFHMTVARHSDGMAIKLIKTPPENYCRPAIDPMLRSLTDAYGKHVLAVILTGMGQDGWKGGEIVVNAGGAVVAQDEATSVVWGMPGAVANAGLCSAVLPINEIGQAIRDYSTNPDEKTLLNKQPSR